jgi:hypothetical protein
MVILRCTQKLLARLKRPVVAAPGTSSTRLGDWFGHELRLGRQQHLLFVSGCTRLAAVIPARDAHRLPTVLAHAVSDRLAAIGVSAQAMDQERRHMAEVVFTRTDNRSVVGTISDYAFMAKDLHARGEAPETLEELMEFLASTPIVALGGVRPIDLVHAAFAGHSPHL